MIKIKKLKYVILVVFRPVLLLRHKNHPPEPIGDFQGQSDKQPSLTELQEPSAEIRESVKMTLSNPL